MKILDKYKEAKSIRQTSDAIRQEAGYYAWPDAYQGTNYGNETVPTTGKERFNSTATNASLRMASGVFSYLMPVGNSWFVLKPVNYEDLEDENISRYLSNIADVTHLTIYRSNFITEMFAAIRSILTFGYGAISVEIEDKDLVFRSFSVDDIYFEENGKGKIDVVFRKMFYNARQAIGVFGLENVSKNIQKEFKAGGNAKFEFVHCVYPRDNYNPEKVDAGGKKFVSQYIEVDTNTVVKEGGFDSMPYNIGRFMKIPNNIYGSSPVIECLSDIKMLNAQAKTYNLGCELEATPAYAVEESVLVGEINTSPNGITYYRMGTNPPRPLNKGVNIANLDITIQRNEQKITEALFNHLFQTLADYRNMTATEVIGRREEALTMLSPIIMGLQKELLDPLIKRVIELLKDRLPKYPVDFDIVYVGRLAMAMSKNQSDAAMNHIASWMPLAQIAPEISKCVNWTKAFKDTGISGGMKAQWLKSDDEIDEEMQAEQQAQQVSQELLASESASKSLLNVSKAENLGR